MNRTLNVLVLLVLLVAASVGCDDGGNNSPEDCSVLPAAFDQDTILPKGCYLAEVTPTLSPTVHPNGHTVGDPRSPSVVCSP